MGALDRLHGALAPAREHLRTALGWANRMLVRLLDHASATLQHRLPARPSAFGDRRALPVLCFGDSLTEGYHGVWVHPEFSPKTNPGADEIGNILLRPYSIRLGHRLAVDASDGAEGYRSALRYANVRAYSGFTAEELLPALRAALRERPWRCACILAGSNDVVLEGQAAPMVLERIARLHEACDAAGVPVIALTLPEADLAHHGLVPPGDAMSRQAVLAEVAEGLAATCRASRRACADVRAALPLGATYFDDCMHPNAAGSDRIADTVYDVLHRHGL